LVKYVELKLREDNHNSGFSNGLTLCKSQSTVNLEKVGGNTYKNPNGHTIVINEQTNDDITTLSTTFYNTSKNDTTIEMLSSFALKDIECDKIYRMQSFGAWKGNLKLRAYLICI